MLFLVVVQGFCDYVQSLPQALTIFMGTAPADGHRYLYLGVSLAVLTSISIIAGLMALIKGRTSFSIAFALTFA